MLTAGVVLFYVFFKIILRRILMKSFDISTRKIWKITDQIVFGVAYLFVVWMLAFQFTSVPQRIINMPTAPYPEPTQAKEVPLNKTNEAREDADAALMEATQLFNSNNNNN